MNKYIKIWNKTTNSLIETTKLTNENLTKKQLAKDQLIKIYEARPEKDKELLEQNLNKQQKEFILWLMEIAEKEE